MLEDRYKLFIECCEEVCKAYGITIEQYFNITINKNIFDYENEVNFNQIYNWKESEEFIKKYKGL